MTPCHMAEKRLFLPPFRLFNVAVRLSRTLTYMLTYNIDWGMGGEGKWPYRTDKVLELTLDCEKVLRTSKNTYENVPTILSKIV